MEFVSAGSIVQQAAQQLGLAGSTYSDGTVITDPYSSGDANIVRLRSLLASLGQGLRGERQWNILRQQYLFNTVAGQGVYPLPIDYDRYIDQTGWNRTNRLPLGGPISAQDRAVLKSLLVNVTLTVLFDTIDGQFAAFPDNTVLPGAFVIAYFYQSLYWVCQQPVTYSRIVATTYATNQVVVDNGNYFLAFTGGLSAAQAGGLATVRGTQTDGAVVWVWIDTWAPNVTYVKGQAPQLGTVLNANGQIYYCATAGKSATTGTGPSGNGVGIPEGGNGVALWTWLAPFPVAAGQSLASCNAAAPTLSTDVVYFDQPFMVAALKRKWRIENGWPISEEMALEYNRSFAKVKSADAVGKMLSLDRRAGGVPLIGSQNVPFGGFGG